MTVPQYNSECNLLQSRHTQHLLNHWRLDIIVVAHIVASECVENAENLAASVTLTKHGDQDLLRHCVFFEC